VVVLLIVFGLLGILSFISALIVQVIWMLIEVVEKYLKKLG